MTLQSLCPGCRTPLAAGRRDWFVERPTGYTLVRHVAADFCPTCGEVHPAPSERARVDAAASGRRTWSALVCEDALPDFRPRPGEPVLVLRPPEPPRLRWSAGKAGALLVVLLYLSCSLLTDNDARMLRAAAYAAAAFALIWFSNELGARFNMPRWTGTAMGWFLLVFPVAVLSLFAVV